MLPRRVGERLAERTGERVAWIAVGKKAADAATIRRDVVPALRRRLHARRDRPSVGFVGDGFRTEAAAKTTTATGRVATFATGFEPTTRVSTWTRSC